MELIKILFIGDIVGGIGRETVAAILPGVKKEYQPDLIIANGENAAAGFGITDKVYQQLVYDCDIDLLTSGNHIWDKKEILKDIKNMEKLVRPINYPNCQRGAGYSIVERKGKRICVLNVMGRVFMGGAFDCPFQMTEKLIEDLKDQADIFFADIHAEATSEKEAFAKYFENKLSAVVGTHTHVQTADERIMAGGCAYISDAGMVGAVDAVLGMDAQPAINRFLCGTNDRFNVPKKGETKFNAVYIEIAAESGKAQKIVRVNRNYEVK